MNQRWGLTRSCRMGSLMFVALCSATSTNAVRKTDCSVAPAACCQSQNNSVIIPVVKGDEEQEEELTTILLGLKEDLSVKEPSGCWQLRISQPTESDRPWWSTGATGSSRAIMFTTSAVSLRRETQHRCRSVIHPWWQVVAVTIATCRDWKYLIMRMDD